ncbi:ABC transporter substrate-binding protein [Paenibacillus ehimensis]|uniref:ABC transporter substrate-binding protein n=1 Tax=Paenibacillus ehimensis TaxID=79264 RepID=A0ABT8V5I8_9BACL|nr:ABC transporter substrate-binding protein [Paenibacillus ehimensis]MDO3676694.1 ABC transporter substrate-binding protein [Paenibacillus ehimensis]MEC0209832.1 ABC transporter substrate-binding protein [Paenibacillus ehimensis]
MKKSLSVILSVGLASGMVLAGCAKEEAKPAPAGDAPKGGEPVTVTLAGWGSTPEEQDLLKQTIQEFESKHPNVKVKYEVIADQYMDVIKTRLIGGEGPDVFYLDAFEAPALIEKGVIEPLDGYVKPEFDVADFEEPLLNAFKVGGKTYGFPKDSSTLAMFYNKKHFEEAGIAKPPATWEELQEAAKKLTKTEGGKTVRFGFGVAPELARQMFMAQAFGGKVSDDKGNAAFASPEALKGLQLVVDLHNKDKSSGEPKEVGAGWGGEMFGQGKASIVFEGNWAIPFLNNNYKDLQYATAELPTVNGKKGTMAFTVAYVMNKASKKKEASWELISYLTGKEGMKTWTSKGFALPTRKSVAKELGYDKDPLRGALVAGSAYATPWQAGPTLPTVMNNFNNQFLDAFLGKSSLEEAMKKAQDTANKEIAAGK